MISNDIEDFKQTFVDIAHKFKEHIDFVFDI